MKLPEWITKRSTQEWAMIAVITMLLIMIATRWGYTSYTAGKAFRDRFVPPSEQADSTSAAVPAAE